LFFSKFWIGGTGRELLRIHGDSVALTAVYVMTSREAHLSGIFYLPLHTIMSERNISHERVSDHLKILHQEGFCLYDPDTEIIFIKNMGKYQARGFEKIKDSRVQCTWYHLNSLPETYLKTEFIKHYKLTDVETTRGDDFWRFLIEASGGRDKTNTPIKNGNEIEKGKGIEKDSRRRGVKGALTGRSDLGPFSDSGGCHE